MHEIMRDPTVQVFALCAAILVLKMVITGSLTGLLRFRYGAFITPEDYALMGKEPSGAAETVERVRRAHQNDLENILPFLALGPLYSLSGPSPGVASTLFIVFTIARVLHTVTYLARMQPWRSIMFEVANISLVVMTVLLMVNILGA